MSSQSSISITTSVPILVDYVKGVFVPRQSLNLSDSWSGSMYLGRYQDPRPVQRASLFSLLSQDNEKDEREQILPLDEVEALFLLPLVFVDASAWLKIIDITDGQHQAILDKVLSFPDGVWVTGDYVTKEFSQKDRNLFPSTKINWLMWLLWSDRLAKSITSRQEEDVAWDIFMELDDKYISFYQCLTAILVYKYKPQHVIIADEHFSSHLPNLIEKIEKKLIEGN